MVMSQAPSMATSTSRTMPRSTIEMTGISGSETSASHAQTSATVAVGAAARRLVLMAAAVMVNSLFSRLPGRAGIGALQELHLGQDEAQMLAMPALLAALLHPGVGRWHGQRGFGKNLGHVGQPLCAQLVGRRCDAG